MNLNIWRFYMNKINLSKLKPSFLLTGLVYLGIGILQQFFVNHLFETALMAITVSIIFAILCRVDKKKMILFSMMSILNVLGLFNSSFTLLSVLGLTSSALGAVLVIFGLVNYYRKEAHITWKVIITTISVAMIVLNGFLSVTTLKPSVTMAMLGSSVMGSSSANLSHAEQKETSLENGTKVVSDVQYDAQVPNGFLDVYYTTKTSSKTAPTFIYIHGGGYVWGDKASGDPNVRDSSEGLFRNSFLEQGYNVVQLNYALAPDYQFPVAIKQLNRGLDFLVKHGSEYGLDMANVVIGGGSAGGNLAGLLVNIQTNPKYAEVVDEKAVINPEAIKSVVFQAALFDNSQFGNTGSPMVDWLFTQLGRLYLNTNELQNNTKVTAPTNVTDYVTKNFPPTFISDGNTGTFNNQAFKINVKLSELGIDTDLIYFPKEVATLTHGHEGVDTKYSRVMLKSLFHFLDNYFSR